MNSDERLNRELDRVQAPSLSGNFHDRLFTQTRPKPGLLSSIKGWFSDDHHTRRLIEGAVLTASLLVVVLLLPGTPNSIDEDNDILAQLSAIDPELLWLTVDEDFNEELLDPQEASDSGLADLYAVLD